MSRSEPIYRLVPRDDEADRGGARPNRASPFVFRIPRAARTDVDGAGDLDTTSSIEGFLRPTWEEVDQARDQFARDARRFRLWKGWFIGMFTVYTTLAGILLLELVTGP